MIKKIKQSSEHKFMTKKILFGSCVSMLAVKRYVPNYIWKKKQLAQCTFSNILGQKWRGLHDNMTNGVKGKDFNFFCLKSTYEAEGTIMLFGDSEKNWQIQAQATLPPYPFYRFAILSGTHLFSFFWSQNNSNICNFFRFLSHVMNSSSPLLK